MKIPADWKGKRIWLKAGGVRNVGWFWLNCAGVGMTSDNYGARKWEVTSDAKPGEENVVFVEVNNELPCRDAGARAVSGARLRVTVEGETKEFPLSTSTSSLHLEVPLRNFRAWSPEYPNLYWATIELLEDWKVVQVRKERFGVRKFEIRG